MSTEKNARLEDDMNVGRTADFERDASLEKVLSELNAGIATVMPPPYATPRYPVIFIVGAPRSGTTLMSQWLAASGKFAYPSNLIARFYANPYFGARVQQGLHTFDPQGQILGEKGGGNFSSDLGRTQGALAPSEFWYFWRRFFTFGSSNLLTEDMLSAVDVGGFLAGLAGLEAALDMPVVTKAMILNWNLPFLDKITPHVLFVNVKRDPFYNVPSLLSARERFFGDRHRWYSFKPPEYCELKELSPIEQVTGQIYYNRQAVADGLRQVHADRKLTIDYSEFCASPAGIYQKIRNKLSRQGYDIANDYDGPSEFEESRKITLNDADRTALQQSLAKFTFD